MRRLVFFAFFLSLFCSGACVRIESETRSISRVAPLKDVAFSSARIDETRFFIRVYQDALDDNEYKQVQNAVLAALAESVQAKESTEVMTPLNATLLKQKLSIRVERCTLDALASRKNTVFRATCRLSLFARGALLAEASAAHTRIGGAKSVTEKRAKEISKQVRNPLLDYAESEKALKGAALLALDTLLSGRVDDNKTNKDTRIKAPDALRLSALKRLTRRDLNENERAAAIIDLGQNGTPDDASLLFEHLQNENALVQLSAASAIAQLCPSSQESVKALDSAIQVKNPRLMPLLKKAKACAQLFSAR